jgi:hypothetical protein
MFGGLVPALLGSVLAGGVSALAGLRWSRTRVYRRLNEKIGRFNNEPSAFPASFALRLETPDFSDRFAVVRELLPHAYFEAVSNEIARLEGERSYIPAHKQGGTVAYEHLIARAPATVGLYHNVEFQNFISRTVGIRIQPTPVWDQSSLSLLVYDRPGDHIGWHYDHDFYRGRHFTVLLIIRNEGIGPQQLSHCVLNVNRQGKITAIPTPANSLVVFEGARILHMVTPVREKEIRIALSMTYCTDDRAWWWQDLARRMKDTAFFGMRAL